MDNGQQFAPRKMVQGKWSCSSCGNEITELPFEPDPNRPVYCRDCHRNNRRSGPPRSDA